MQSKDSALLCGRMPHRHLSGCATLKPQYRTGRWHCRPGLGSGSLPPAWYQFSLCTAKWSDGLGTAHMLPRDPEGRGYVLSVETVEPWGRGLGGGTGNESTALFVLGPLDLVSRFPTRWTDSL